MAKFKPLGINIPRFQFGTQKSGIQLQYSGPSYQEIREKMRRENPHAYNELQARVAGGKSPSSEIVKYIDADGNFRSAPNVGAGYLPAADPVGELVVEGVVVNKPLKWVGNGIWSRIRKLARSPNGAITSSNPRYIMKPSNVDELELTKKRLQEGGFDRLEKAILEDVANFKSYGYTDVGRKHIVNNRDKILSSKPFEGPVSEFNRKFNRNYEVEDGAAGLLTQGYTKPFQETGITDIGNRATAHEFSHYVYWPNSHPPGFNPTIDFKDYFLPKASGAGEITARGTQLKNYFRLREGQSITPEMWEYAKKNYVKDTGLDNDMTEFFNSVDSNRLQEFLNWLNKHSPIIATPIGLKTIYGINNASTNTNK